jgi:protein TonB
MSTAADPFGGRDRREAARWTTSLSIVLLLHGALLWLAIRHRVAVEPIGTPPAAVLIDLPPAPPIGPEPAPTPEPAPEPKLETVIPELPAPPKTELEFPKLEALPMPKPAVALPPPAKTKPRAKPVERTPAPRPQPAPALPAPATPAPPAAARSPSGPASSAASARATWQAQLLAWLERHKRYPRVAQEQRQQGTAQLRFTLDREGRVLSYRLDRGSGFALLDEEVAELIRRAAPVPPPPPEVAGSRIEVLVPVSFFLRRGSR